MFYTSCHTDFYAKPARPVRRELELPLTFCICGLKHCLIVPLWRPVPTLFGRVAVTKNTGIYTKGEDFLEFIPSQKDAFGTAPFEGGRIEQIANEQIANVTHTDFYVIN